jgi:hypothetical protein
MKKTNKVSLLLVAMMAIMAIVAVFVLFAPSFYNGTRGTAFQAIFGNEQDMHRAAVPMLIVAFALEVAGIVIPFTSVAFSKKGQMGVFAIEAVVMIAAAVIFLFAKTFYVSANNAAGYPVDTAELGTNDGRLGAGFVCAIVFSFLSAAFALLGILNAKKSD